MDFRDYDVLRRPLLTEKAAMFAGVAGGSAVVFEVVSSATKGQIKLAVERVFKVRVKAVRTANYLGKKKRRGQHVGRQSAWKKAYVTLESGHTIDVVEGL